MISLFDIPLAARSPNFDAGWIEILIPIFIIIVYAVNGILKMRSNLKDQQKSEEAPQKPRYRPLPADSLEWERPSAETEERDSVRLERMLEVKPMPRTEPVVRPRQAPAAAARPPQYAQPPLRRTLDAFLATQAPKPLAERIAEARAKAEAQARTESQAQARPEPPKPLWPRASERQEVARTRKPKVPAPTPTPPAAARARPPEPPVQPQPPPALGDLTEMDTLRKAIVYSEVLGRPLALRDMDV